MRNTTALRDSFRILGINNSLYKEITYPYRIFQFQWITVYEVIVIMFVDAKLYVL